MVVWRELPAQARGRWCGRKAQACTRAIPLRTSELVCAVPCADALAAGHEWQLLCDRVGREVITRGQLIEVGEGRRRSRPSAKVGHDRRQVRTSEVGE